MYLIILQDDFGQNSKESLESIESSGFLYPAPQHSTKPKPRPQSWHMEANINQSNPPPSRARHQSLSTETQSRVISDSDAKMLSEPYRLMTTTHSRLSSVSPPMTRPSSDLSQNAGSSDSLNIGKKVQPVLGLRQRRRKQSENRRRTVHGIVYQEKTTHAPKHRRTNSETALDDVEPNNPLMLQMSGHRRAVSNSSLKAVDEANEVANQKRLDGFTSNHLPPNSALTNRKPLTSGLNNHQQLTSGLTYQEPFSSELTNQEQFNSILTYDTTTEKSRNFETHDSYWEVFPTQTAPRDYVPQQKISYVRPHSWHEPIYHDTRDVIHTSPPVPHVLNYEYNEVHSVQDGTHYYYEQRHQSRTSADEPILRTEVYGKHGVSGYSVLLTPAESAIGKL